MSEELRNNNKEMEINIAENAVEIMLVYTDLVNGKKIKSMSDEDIYSLNLLMKKLLEKYGIKKREITYVRFYNGKEHVYITVPMVYEESNECLNAKQRCMAYDKLSEYVSDEFIHDTVISDYFRKGKVTACYE